MSMNTSVKSTLRNILEIHDINKMKIDKKFGDYKYYKIAYNKTEMNDIMLYDDKKKLITKSKIQYLAIYMPNIKLWKWGWSLVMNKKNVFASRKILQYVLDIDDTNRLFLREPLLNSNITINNQLELDLLVAISSYITKQNCIMGFYMIPDEDKDSGFYNVKNVEEGNDKENYLIMYYILVDE